MPSDIWLSLYIIILALFIGYEVIVRVPVILHTPLMSGSNFIHGIVLIGGIYALGYATTVAEQVIGFLAVVMGSLNVTGGFRVTQRMLSMFTKRKGQAEHDRPH